MVSQTDIIILGLGAVLAVLYLYRESIFGSAKMSSSGKLASGMANGTVGGGEDEGDFAAKLKAQVRVWRARASVTILCQSMQCN